MSVTTCCTLMTISTHLFWLNFQYMVVWFFVLHWGPHSWSSFSLFFISSRWWHQTEVGNIWVTESVTESRWGKEWSLRNVREVTLNYTFENREICLSLNTILKLLNFKTNKFVSSPLIFFTFYFIESMLY